MANIGLSRYRSLPKASQASRGDNRSSTKSTTKGDSKEISGSRSTEGSALYVILPLTLVVVAAMAISGWYNHNKFNSQRYLLSGLDAVLVEAIDATCEARFPLPIKQSTGWWNSSECLVRLIGKLQATGSGPDQGNLDDCRNEWLGVKKLLSTKTFQSANVTVWCQKSAFVGMPAMQCPKFVAECASLNERCRIPLSAARSLGLAARMRTFMEQDNGQYLRVRSEFKRGALIFADEIGFMIDSGEYVGDKSDSFLAAIVLAEVLVARSSGTWLERELHAYRRMPSLRSKLNDTGKEDYWSLRVENLCAKLLPYASRKQDPEAFKEAFGKLYQEHVKLHLPA